MRERRGRIFGGDISEGTGVTGGVKVIREVYAGPCRGQQGNFSTSPAALLFAKRRQINNANQSCSKLGVGDSRRLDIRELARSDML